MATYINLLPWRQAQKNRAKKHLIYQSLGVIVIVGILLMGEYLFLAKKIQAQINLHLKMTSEIKKLDNQLVSLEKGQQQKEDVLAKMKVMDFLQMQRTLPIKILDLIPRCIPKGIYLTNMVKTSEQITLEGKAQSAKLISDFMRELENTATLYPPQLIWVQNDAFQLSIREKTIE